MFNFGDFANDFVQTLDTVTVASSNTSQFTGDITITGSLTPTQIGNNISNDKFTFGNGNGDSVQTLTEANITGATITGNLTVTQTGGNISNDTIIFGNGKNDDVRTEVDTQINSVTVGTASGGGNVTIAQTLGMISNDTIVFGNGNHDRVDVFADFGILDLSSNTFPNNPVSGGGISNDKITFGNGNSDGLSGGFSSNNDKIVLGNGARDFVVLGGGPTNVGGDTIITGTGTGDNVFVGLHQNADTFGFALGTTGKSFTTISGAQAGDHVISGNNLGTNVVTEPGSFASMLDFFKFVIGIHPTNDHTYIGHSATDTFIVTDHNGHLGAVDLVGIFTGHVANHVLTLS